VPPRADSIAMITAAVSERAEAEPQECDRLAELCGDLPLALDIALRKLVARPDLPLHRATAKLMERDGALNWLCIGDLSLREALNSVYQEVSESARTLLTRIARLPFRCDPDSVMYDGGELAEELMDAGLLRRGDLPGTYLVTQLVRAFTIEAGMPSDDRTELPLRIDVPMQRSRLGTLSGWDATGVRRIPELTEGYSAVASTSRTGTTEQRLALIDLVAPDRRSGTGR